VEPVRSLVVAEGPHTSSGQQNNALDMAVPGAGMNPVNGKLLPHSLVGEEDRRTSAHQPYNKEGMACSSSYTSLGAGVALAVQVAEVVEEGQGTFSYQEGNTLDME
jgi:hypothetical protein